MNCKLQNCFGSLILKLFTIKKYVRSKVVICEYVCKLTDIKKKFN